MRSWPRLLTRSTAHPAQQVIADGVEEEGLLRGESSVEIAASAVMAEHQINTELRGAVRRRPAQHTVQQDAVVRLNAYEIDVHKTLTRSCATECLYFINSRPPPSGSAASHLARCCVRPGSAGHQAATAASQSRARPQIRLSAWQFGSCRL
jgi:hypothetical protein